MPESRFELDVFGTDYICDHCHEGTLELIGGNYMLLTNPPQFIHKCTNCKLEGPLPDKYPKVHHERKVVQ